MKKLLVLINSGEHACKRSLTMAQIEVCFILCASLSVDRHRKYFNLTLAFYGGEFNKAITIKRLPNGYLPKFTMQKP